MYYIEWTLESGQKVDIWRDEYGNPVVFNHYMSCEMVCDMIPIRFPNTLGRVVPIEFKVF